jgi:hypothetical protein
MGLVLIARNGSGAMQSGGRSFRSRGDPVHALHGRVGCASLRKGWAFVPRGWCCFDIVKEASENAGLP